MRDLMEQEISSVSGGFRGTGWKVLYKDSIDGDSPSGQCKAGSGGSKSSASSSDQSCFNKVVEEAGLGAIFGAVASKGNPIAMFAGGLAGAINAARNSDECKSSESNP